MFGQYKRLRNEWVGILTGKGCEFTDENGALCHLRSK